MLADTRWKIVGTNDFNGDGRMDLLWRHGASGENVVWFMNGVDLVSGTFTNPAALVGRALADGGHGRLQPGRPPRHPLAAR